MLGGNVDSPLTAQRPVPASDPPTTGTMPSAGRVAACPPCSVGSVGSVHGTGGSCSASGCSVAASGFVLDGKDPPAATIEQVLAALDATVVAHL